jgi:23S rRNA pseudouridine1911/1915/1917 synthase
MLSWVVNDRHTSQRSHSSALRFCLSPMLSYSYKLPLSCSRNTFSFLSCTYKLPSSQLLSFEVLTNARGCRGSASWFSPLTSNLQHLTSAFSNSYELFCVCQKLNPLLFKQLRTLLPKHPGVGYPSRTACYNLTVSSPNTATRTARRELVASPADTGTRLDRFVAAQCPELSRTRVQELIESGLVRIDGKAASKGALHLRGGEKITLEITERPAIRAEAEAIPLDVLYEDDDVIAINKPAGMTVHAGAGAISGTLVNALLGRGQSLAQSGDPLRPGIVHRLDKETSGVILVAKNDTAHAKLGEAFRQRAVKKTYIALVQGSLKEKSGRIELAIARDPIRRTRMTVERKTWHGAALVNPRAARTDWRVLATIGNTTLLEVQLHTGRTHQIRVHFSALKHPVVGDALYGAAAQLRAGNVTLAALGRNFLHAAKLGFAQPRTGEWIEVRASLPAELHAFLEKLSAAAGEPQSRIDAALAGYL